MGRQCPKFGSARKEQVRLERTLPSPHHHLFAPLLSLDTIPGRRLWFGQQPCVVGTSVTLLVMNR